MRLKGSRLERRLERDFGRIPDPYYAVGDMEYIRSYFDWRRGAGRDSFLLDEITWNDLDLDRVFRRINPALSTSGEQYLYYMLRSPAIEAEVYAGRQSTIALMEKKPGLRLKLQVILARLGCTRRADLTRAFAPSAGSYFWLIVYLVLLLLVPATLIYTAFAPQLRMLFLMLVFIVNSSVHEFRKREIQRDLDTVNYSVRMVFAMNRIRSLQDPELDVQLQAAYESLDRLRSVVRVGGVSTASDDAFGGLLLMVLLLDLITYELLKHKLGRHHEDIFRIHEHLGKLDAGIAIASYRQSLGHYAIPELDFTPQATPHIEAQQMVHPLLENAVPNDLSTSGPLLITGSNASGKSTYLKTAALCAVLAQSICTCPAASYKASAFRIYSSMALKDNVLAGESYYIVETKSLKRILDNCAALPPIFCVIDEVLRGTNTVERIAASSVVLRELAERGAICLAATHDIELCDLLQDDYALFHFSETVTRNEMHFDYRIRPGRATSRNAINLLRILGFDDGIVDSAHQRADHYIKSGVWK